MRTSALFFPTRSPFLSQNQLIIALMKGIDARRDALADVGRALPPPPATGAFGFAVGTFAALVLALTALLSTGIAEPIVLGLLAILAAIGVFFVFGVLAGYVRVSERVALAELAASAANEMETGVQIVASDGAVLFSNPAFARVLGRANASDPAPALDDALAGEPAAAEAMFRLTLAARRGEARREDVILDRAPGDAAGERWLRVSVQPHGAPGQRLTRWTVADITEDRTRDGDRIGQLETTLSHYRAMPLGLFVTGLDGQILQANEALFGRLGVKRSSDRAGTLALADFVTADTAELILAFARSPVTETVRFEVELKRESGAALPVELVCRRQKTVGGKDAVFAFVVENDPNDHHAGAKASQPGRALPRVLQGAPIGIATIDATGHILTANTAFDRMFIEHGCRPGVSIGKLIVAETDATAREAMELAIAKAISGRTSGAPVELAFGKNRDIVRRVYSAPVASGNGEGEAAVLYVIDASEQKALELKFAQSQKMEAVGKLAGGIAHDFNNVLTVIIGLSDFLLQSRRPTDPGYTDMQQIKSNANRAAGMVRQLLAFSRKQTLTPEVLSLNDLIQDFGYSLNRLLTEKVELKVQAGRDLWYVKADKHQFEQVLINFAVNAKDAMPQGGRLVVRTRNLSERDSMKFGGQGMQPGEYVLVEVEDTGTGIPQDIIQKIFEPFFSTKDIGKGTGLGLSTVYGIVKQTGGFVFVDSVMGKGTTFRVLLPRHIETEKEIAAAKAVKKKEAPRDLTGTGRVLLVEDEDAVRSFAVRALQRQGYEVIEAISGLDALDIMAKETGKIDIVVSDVMMPEMDGPTMLKELRKTHPDLKIIFVSGYPDDAFKRSLGEDEQFAFLPKPFTLPQLATKVKEELGR